MVNSFRRSTGTNTIWKRMQALSISLIYYTKFRHVYRPYFNFRYIQPSKKHERPSLVMTEITITNIEDHHKGRVDVLAHGIV